MKLTRKTVSGVIYAAALLASTNAPALTLGKLRGGALLGQALDVAVAVQYAAAEEVDATCFAADVQFGESRVDAARVTVRTQAGAQPNTQVVRITSSARVDEAVVTINLKTACGPKAERRYVLLSDVVSELSVNASPATSAARAAVSESVPKTPAPTPGAAATATTRAPLGTAPVPAKVRQKPAAKAGTSPAKKPDAGTLVLGQANAEALDALHRRVDDIEKWQTQSTAADEVLKSQERTKAIETDIQGLKTVTAKNQQNLQTVASALEASESQSYGRSLVYALGALLAACVAALAYVLTRTRSNATDTAPWWSGGDQRAQAKPALPPAPPPPEPAPAEPVPSATRLVAAPSEATQPSGPGALATASQAVVNVDLDLDLEHASAPAAASPPTATAAFPVAAAPSGPTSGHAEFSNSVQGQLRAINTQEMLDIRQQAEFFMALGQHDDAVQLLEGSIQNSAEANPLVFLDLLKIFHTLSRRGDFERYREEFNQHFTGRLPPYGEFLVEGNGLDAYEDICQQIVVLWPTEYTIDFIEQCLVRTPEDDPEQGIDLDAFKDLLLLYGVLKRLDQTSDSAFVPFSTSRTFNTQAGALQAAPGVPAVPKAPVEQARAPAMDLPVAASAVPLPALPDAADEFPSVNLDLDLDLDLSVGPVEPAKPDPGNLIDFDISGLIKPDLKPPK